MLAIDGLVRTFDASAMPSHRMNSGTQAIEGMLRRPRNKGSSSRRTTAE